MAAAAKSDEKTQVRAEAPAPCNVDSEKTPELEDANETPSAAAVSEVHALDEETKAPTIKLVDSAGGKHEIDTKSARMSRLVNTALASGIAFFSFEHNSILDTDPGAQEIAVAVASAELNRVVAFMAHHGGVAPAPIEQPLQSRDLAQCVRDKWDAKFMSEFKRMTEYYDLASVRYRCCCFFFIHHSGGELSGYPASVAARMREDRLDDQGPQLRRTRKDLKIRCTTRLITIKYPPPFLHINYI